MKFLIVNDIKEINLTKKGWVDSPKFEADKFVDANGKRIKKSYTGQRYSLIAIREREFSCLEVIGRRFLGLIAVIVTLGLAYFKSKTVKDLLNKTRKRIYYGMVPADKNPNLAKIEALNPIKSLKPANLNEPPKNLPEVIAHDIAKIDARPNLIEPNPKKIFKAETPPAEVLKIPSTALKVDDLAPQVIEQKNHLDAKIENKPAVILDVPKQDTPNIFIKMMGGKTIEITAYPAETIEDVKKKIELIDRTPVQQQRLIYDNKELANERWLSDYNIQPYSTIFMYINIRGD